LDFFVKDEEYHLTSKCRKYYILEAKTKYRRALKFRLKEMYVHDFSSIMFPIFEKKKKTFHLFLLITKNPISTFFYSAKETTL